MLIDCDTCVVRGAACSECVIAVLLRRPPTGTPVDLDADETAAFDSLADAGMVPPLRLVPVVTVVPACDTPGPAKSASSHRRPTTGPREGRSYRGFEGTA
ncbi:hypothetical protein [uncultured Jatrophihabitans sp.]|uniref:hypothetical protein n=1 Tax=uncultured Jatrophihabitans sp. TaxID=1610747 RepID=UPI0035CC1728